MSCIFLGTWNLGQRSLYCICPNSFSSFSSDMVSFIWRYVAVGGGNGPRNGHENNHMMMRFDKRQTTVQYICASVRVNLALLHAAAAASVPIFFIYRASILLHSCALCIVSQLNITKLWLIPLIYAFETEFFLILNFVGTSNNCPIRFTSEWRLRY